jgi:hypothetical protein
VNSTDIWCKIIQSITFKKFLKHFIENINLPTCCLLLSLFICIVQDKQLKCTVYRITGSIPAGNYIQFPRTSTQSLSLTGRYLYLLFKPISGKYFVAHIDIATEDSLAVRISFSNLFKEFKSTSTWLQFPFVPRPPPGSVDEAILASPISHGMVTILYLVY